MCRIALGVTFLVPCKSVCMYIFFFYSVDVLHLKYIDVWSPIEGRDDTCKGFGLASRPRSRSVPIP